MLRYRSIPLFAGLSLLWAGAAAAVPQFTPTATQLLHTTGSGQPGAEWNTGGTGGGGQISYDSGTGLLSITAALDVLNYYDPGDPPGIPADPSCPTDVGTTCSFNYGPDLDITIEAEITAISVEHLAGTFFNVVVNWGTVAGGGTDLTVTDPADGDSVQLSADWVAGTFNGSPTDGLQAQVLYDAGSGSAVFDDVNSVGVLGNLSGAYATLFGDTQLGINLGTLSDFSPVLDTVAAGLAASCSITISTTSCDPGDLPSFTAEANSQVFRTDTGQFVPEPGAALLLIPGLVLALRRKPAHA